jgi:hypothetical protein
LTDRIAAVVDAHECILDLLNRLACAEHAKSGIRAIAVCQTSAWLDSQRGVCVRVYLELSGQLFEHNLKQCTKPLVPT